MLQTFPVVRLKLQGADRGRDRMSDKIKVKVLRTFRNKYSKSLHKRGDLLTISEKRMQEINSAGYGKLVEPVKEGG